MTNKQRMFADEYLVNGLNATQAYKAVYKNVKKDETARAAGSRLLANVNVKAYVDEQLEKIHDEKTADLKEVLEFHTSVLRGEEETEALMIIGIGEGCSEVTRVQKKPEINDRQRSAAEITKILGGYNNNLNISVEPITIVEDLDE